MCAVIAVTVVLSVIAHGVTAEPLAGRYAAILARSAPGQAHAAALELPPRKLIRLRGWPARQGHRIDT
jgi:sodium/hydrogen antiporter